MVEIKSILVLGVFMYIIKKALKSFQHHVL
ncbi:hypothetical protein DSUL_100080 [Desulfovibrionales bacterium]